jgi:hypothetical protein
LKEDDKAKTMQNKNESILSINCIESISKIEGFIKDKIETLNRRGVVLGLSGGLSVSSGCPHPEP